jgi:hypothetical protein
MLHGKGIYIWEVQECENGDPQQIVAQALAAGLQHALVKVSDGTDTFPAAIHESKTIAAIHALRSAGVTVWGWGFVYGANPIGEADIAIQRINALQLPGFVIDAEGHYRDRPTGTATRYMERLRAALPHLPLALSSFRFPSTQGAFPFDEFLRGCQVAMPQVYWVAQSGGDPARQLRRSYQEYADRWPDLIYIPTGAAYGEWQENGAWWWTARPDQITTFLSKAQELGLPVVNFWSWQHARFDSANPDYPGTRLWQAVAGFPWPGGEPAPQPETRPVEAVVALKFRSQPDPDDAHWIDNIVFPQGTPFTALGYPTWPDEMGGYRSQRIRTVDGHQGWVGHSEGNVVYLTHDLESRTPVVVATEKQVWVVEPLGLKFRSQPIVSDAYWIDQIVFPPGTRLIAIGSPTLDPGGRYRWQKVRASDGREGYVAYGYDGQVYLSDERPGAPGAPVTAVWSITDLNVRDAAGLHGNVIWTVLTDTRLEVLEDPATAGAKVGVNGEWIHVRTPSLKEGHVAAWYVTAYKPPDERRVVSTPRVGESRYIYGFHDPFDRGIFGQRRGWVLVTEGIGRDPQAAGGNRDLYADWSERGFGVIVRLNHGYREAGTLPEPQHYSNFAATCASWVKRSIDPARPAQGCHIWIIGNEMNNPREWPGNVNAVGGTPITPEGYADCFNQVYDVIKAAQPDAIVCPGAIDPYYGPGSDNGDWFRRMLAHITQLDGFALHTYTHGPDPDLITSMRRFGMDHAGNWTDPGNILRWQYYNFYAYRTYMDMIPTRWRDLPVFITETDQDESWADANSGWVQAAYAEIDRWNQEPHAQQIRALLLYRWPKIGDWPNNPQDDRWWIAGKQGVIDDFKAALSHSYRWRA